MKKRVIRFSLYWLIDHTCTFAFVVINAAHQHVRGEKNDDWCAPEVRLSWLSFFHLSVQVSLKFLLTIWASAFGSCVLNHFQSGNLLCYRYHKLENWICKAFRPYESMQCFINKSHTTSVGKSHESFFSVMNWTSAFPQMTPLSFPVYNQNDRWHAEWLLEGAKENGIKLGKWLTTVVLCEGHLYSKYNSI